MRYLKKNWPIYNKSQSGLTYPVRQAQLNIKACSLMIKVIWSNLYDNLSLSHGICKSRLRLVKLSQSLLYKMSFKQDTYYLLYGKSSGLSFLG